MKKQDRNLHMLAFSQRTLQYLKGIEANKIEKNCFYDKVVKGTSKTQQIRSKTKDWMCILKESTTTKSKLYPKDWLGSIKWIYQLKYDTPSHKWCINLLTGLNIKGRLAWAHKLTGRSEKVSKMCSYIC